MLLGSVVIDDQVQGQLPSGFIIQLTKELQPLDMRMIGFGLM